MDRIQQLMNTIPEGLDAVLVTSSVNRFYFTRFHSSAGILFMTKEKSYFLIDFRYIEVAKQQVKGCEVILQKKTAEQLKELIQKHNVKRIGIESKQMSVSEYLKFKEDLAPAEIVCDNNVTKAIEGLRMIKTAGEVDLIEQAQKLTDETFTHILNEIRPGRTEQEIALEMEFYMRKKGAEGVSFDFIVVSGANSSRPHGVPGDKPIERGDFVTMDFGALVGGYHSDMTRTVAVGEVTDEQRKLYDTVLKAQLASLDAIAPGVSCKDIDAVARNIIYGEGYEGCFGHGLGHSVGVEIHEEPRFGETSKDFCKEGMIMTVEPGIYLEGRFGCRIEDMVWITADGCKNLTKSDKQLIIL